MSTGKNKKMLIALAVSAVVLLAVAVGTSIYSNRGHLSLNVIGSDHIYVEWGESFKEPAAQAYYTKGNRDGSTVVEVKRTGEVDPEKVGDYILIYTAEYEKLKEEKQVTVTVRDTKAPVIQLKGGIEAVVRPGSTYVEEGFTATDNKDGDITGQVKTEVSADKIVYTVSDKSGNTTSMTRLIVYRDVDAPVITLVGDSEILLEIGAKYEEKGATATDDTDGDISSKITVSGTVDTGKSGVYEIKYTVTDTAGNTASLVRVIKVRDNEAPVLTLTGDKKIYVKRGETFKDPGYSAVDNQDGNVTSEVQVSGSVNTEKLGVYTLTYTVADSFGNEATETREVVVFIQQASTETVTPGAKTVYLTFDDGPGKYTQQVLDILDKYNVKVTFFVTGQFKNYYNMIKKCDEAGHTIALHTYTHDWDIYSSSATYFNDLQRIADLVKEQTGKDASIIRFPGGSSNAISKKYWVGAMTTLTQQVTDTGYKYVDWNVDSGDTTLVKKDDGTTRHYTKEEVVAQTTKALKSRANTYSIVLQHDIQKHSVDALEEIILWGLENGYTFLPMTNDSPMYHHKLNN